MTESRLPQRKTPAHPPVHAELNRSTVVFVTVCTASHKRLLGRADARDTLVAAWQGASDWLVGRFVIMPDHVHLFCAPGRPDAKPLKKWVQYWKAVVSHQWPRLDEQPIWQKSFWDTQLRRCENYSAKWEYVRHNPVRAGLCVVPEQWPFQGELNPLRWRE